MAGDADSVPCCILLECRLKSNISWLFNGFTSKFGFRFMSMLAMLFIFSIEFEFRFIFRFKFMFMLSPLYHILLARHSEVPFVQ